MLAGRRRSAPLRTQSGPRLRLQVLRAAGPGPHPPTRRRAHSSPMLRSGAV